MNLFHLLKNRRGHRSELAADIDSYLAEKVEAFTAAGVPAEEAYRRARREFGNVTLTKELSSDEWSAGIWDQIAADIRYAFRGLRRNPAYAVTAVLTLALGIGANAAIFSLLHAVILSTLPVPHAQQLRLMSIERGGDSNPIISYPVLREMQTSVGRRAELAGFSGITMTKTTAAGGDIEQVDTQLVSGNFFSTLGISAQAGRLLTSSDDASTGDYPAVLSDAFWSRHFGRDPFVIGKVLTINDTPVRVAGIAARDFFGLRPGSRPDVWLPIAAQFDIRYNQNVWNSDGDAGKSFLPQPQIHWIQVVARIPDPAVEAQTLSIMNQVHHRDMQREIKGWDDPVEIRGLLQSKIELLAGDKGTGGLRERMSAPLLVLMGAAGLVLLIASVNLASLALAKVIARRKEIAVRCSIGATRGRIVSQFFTEVLALSLAGGMLAIPVAIGVSKVLVRWASDGNPMPLNIHFGAPMLLFILTAAIAAGLIFGLLPALEAINFPLAEAFKANSGAVKGMRLPWGRTLIAAQVMFSFVLLTGAVLFVRTFVNYTNIQMGFAPEHVLSIRIDPRGAHYTLKDAVPVYRRVLDRVREIPGVQSAAMAGCGLARGCQWVSGIRIAGRPPEELRVQENAVTPDYFATVGMRLLSGRLLSGRDIAANPLYAVINSEAAKKFFPGQNPIGQHFGYGKDLSHYEVVGVIADARVNDLHEVPTPMAYYSLLQDPQFAFMLEVRAQGDPAALAQSIRRSVRSVAANLPVLEVKALKAQVNSNLLRERLVAKLASAFALLALSLACLGVYGVLSYAISRRTSEIGIRLALGAAVQSVRWMVIREALVVILIGVGIGIPAAIAVTNLVRSLLYGLSTTDPTAIAASAGALLAIGLTAAYIPALRASRVDPNVALRNE